MHSNGVHSGSPGGAPPVQPLHGPGPAGQSEHGHRARGRHHGHAACEEPEDCFTQAEAEAAAGIPGDDRFERLSPEQQELQARVAAGELTPEQAALLAGSNPPGHENACTAPGNSEYGHEQGKCGEGPQCKEEQALEASLQVTQDAAQEQTEETFENCLEQRQEAQFEEEHLEVKLERQDSIKAEERLQRTDRELFERVHSEDEFHEALKDRDALRVGNPLANPAEIQG